MIGPSTSKHKFITFFILIFSFLFSYGSSAIESNNVINTLTLKIKAKVAQYPNLVCGVCIRPSWLPDDKSTISINGNSAFPAASLIKIPVAVIVLRKIDKGQLSWGQKLTLKQNHYAQGAGYLRTKKIGTKLKLREVFKLMLTISDNTAFNMIVDFLGGINAVNKEIAQLGLKNTKIKNYLGDFKGTNKTSPQDLVTVLEKSLEGDLLSSSSQRLLKSTLLKVNNSSLASRGLGMDVKFAHKTGTIGICVGDAGIVYLPLWKRIKMAIIVKRPFNSLQGKEIIREISKLVYEYLG